MHGVCGIDSVLRSGTIHAAARPKYQLYDLRDGGELSVSPLVCHSFDGT